MTCDEVYARAKNAVSASIPLLENGLPDDAVNRAYYAMFNAARAALLKSGIEVGKTHKGVLNAFSLHFVKTNVLPKEMGRMLNTAELFRFIADYEGGQVDAGTAAELVEMASRFVDAVAEKFARKD